MWSRMSSHDVMFYHMMSHDSLYTAASLKRRSPTTYFQWPPLNLKAQLVTKEDQTCLLSCPPLPLLLLLLLLLSLLRLPPTWHHCTQNL